MYMYYIPTQNYENSSPLEHVSMDMQGTAIQGSIHLHVKCNRMVKPVLKYYLMNFIYTFLDS